MVSTPEYCTVLNTLLAVARISKLRVSPSCMVFESDMLFWMVPGPGMELRAIAVPYKPCRRGEGRGIEPLLQRAAARRQRNAGHAIGPLRAGGAAGHVVDRRLITRRKWRARGKSKCAGDREALEYVRRLPVVNQNLSLPNGSS